MSDALAITIDRPEVRVGETVTATVRVLDDIPEAESLRGYAEATGPDLTAIHYGEVELHSGPVAAGQTFTFSVTLPDDAPFSFEDGDHGLSWHVVANAKISWIEAETAKAPLEVRRVELAPDDDVLAALSPSPSERPYEPGWFGNILLTALAVLLALCMLPLAPFVLMYIANQRLQKIRVRDFALEVPERPVAFGEWIPVKLRFVVTKPIDVASLRLLFDGTKRWKSGDSSRSHRFHEERVTLLEDVILAPRDVSSPGPRGGIYRRGVQRAGEPGVLEVTVPMQLPPDGWPTVAGKITYHVWATLELRGWPDPSGKVQVPTFSALLEPLPERPAALAVHEASPGVAIVRAGEAPPEGVDITIARDRIWPFIAMPTFGAALAVGSLMMTIDERNPPWLILGSLAAVGIVVAAYGLWGFYTRLYR